MSMTNEVQKFNNQLYHTEDSDVSINVLVKNDTLWDHSKGDGRAV